MNNDQQLIEFLATEVMKFNSTKMTYQKIVHGVVVWTIYKSYYNPLEITEQALDLLEAETNTGYEIVKDSIDGYFCVVWTTKNGRAWCDEAKGKELKRTACLAVARAHGWEG